jgi:hypothetical protein
MGFVRYIKAVVLMALRHAITPAQDIIFGLLILAGTAHYFFPKFHMGIDPAGWEAAVIILSGVVATRLVLAPYWIYKEDQAKIQSFGAKLLHDRPTQESLDILAQLLSEGIADILNAPVNTTQQLQNFLAVEDDWNKRLFAHLDNGFTKSDALHVQRLGTILPRAFGHASFQEHGRLLSHFAVREERIRDLLKRGPCS